MKARFLLLLGLLGRPCFSEAFPEFISEVHAFKPDLLKNPEVLELIHQSIRPQYLFHWVRVHREIPLDQHSQIVMPKFNNAIFNSFLPKGAVSAIYAWSHPVTGMGLGDHERYATEYEGRTSTLVLLKPKVDATFGVYVSDPDGWVNNDTPLAPATDFVLHIRLRGKKIIWQEWAMLNPQALEWATDSPDRIQPIVEPLLRNFDPKTMPKQLFHDPESYYVPHDYSKFFSRYLNPPCKTFLASFHERVGAFWKREN